MSTKVHRVVNVIPNTKVKIKTEVISSDDEEDNVGCRVCNKVFASEVALRNHVRMEHIGVYSIGDESLWLLKGAKQIKEETERRIKLKTEKLISSMEPTDVMSLASQDVSYIIIKAEDQQANKPRKRKVEKIVVQKPEKAKRDPKEVQPITGPFECLQPSTQTDGTCHQIFFSCCEYSAHFRDEHTRRRKGLRCQVCEKPLLSNNGEEPLSPYPCEVCGQGFATNKELSEHTSAEHVKLKPFQCHVCHKRFTQQGGVQQHMRMHTGDRPFPCTFCQKAFTQKSGLDQHLRIHTKVKPYRCVICLKTFCQSVHLRQHMRTHTNVSPFQCGICNKRFKQSSHLNYHLKNHNQLNMTEEQKVEFRRMLALMNPQGNVVVINPQDGEVEDQTLTTEEIHEEMETVEEDQILINEEEQILAEQSITIVDDGYILDDVITGI